MGRRLIHPMASREPIPAYSLFVSQMTAANSIAPPLELVQQWENEALELWVASDTPTATHIAASAAQWGADQELEACCEWLASRDLRTQSVAPCLLRAARRPKPLSLREQALRALGTPAKIGEARVIEHRDHELIRRALQELPII